LVFGSRSAQEGAAWREAAEVAHVGVEMVLGEGRRVGRHGSLVPQVRQEGEGVALGGARAAEVVEAATAGATQVAGVEV
jgi:hypothetical protein